MLEHQIPLLDHGYLGLVDAWGSDQRIIEAARMSTAKGFLGWEPYDQCKQCSAIYERAHADDRPPADWRCPESESGSGLHDWRFVPKGDMGLLRYLWENKHATPFEMAGATFEVQAPIFVFREWHRHRVPFGYNELSARYAPMPNLNYLPTLERCKMGGGQLTKQAGVADWSEPLTDAAALGWLERVQSYYEAGEQIYQHGLRIGIPKELARIVIPVGRYSRMRATGNLRGWLAFLALRNAPTAQYEIRVFASSVAKVLAEKFPRTLSLVEKSP